MGLKAVPKGKMGNGLRALSTPVRNKMGYARRGKEMMYPGGGSAPRKRMMGYKAGGGTKKKLTSYQNLGEIETELLEAGLDPNSVNAGIQNYQTTGDISTAINAGMGNGVPQIGYNQGTSYATPGNNMMNPSPMGMERFQYMTPTYGGTMDTNRIGDRFMRRAARKEGRDLMREMRQARRADRREERQDRRMDRRMHRQDKKMGRINARSERQDARQMRRADRQQNRMDRRNARRMGY
tara:strand:+ start:1746 stop:2459 length:714 start_codon:yes stop_codon:yes gene_type:complete